jgi:hypothetical protein
MMPIGALLREILLLNDPSPTTHATVEDCPKRMRCHSIQLFHGYP